MHGTGDHRPQGRGRGDPGAGYVLRYHRLRRGVPDGSVGYGRADLTFGAQGEDTWDGAVLYLPSNSTGLGYGDPVFYGGGTFGLAVDMRLGSTLTP